jgi:hypothetical protein
VANVWKISENFVLKKEKKRKIKMDLHKASNIDSGLHDVHQESDTGNEEYGDESNLERNLRRRKGKIISCAKETIESGS